MSADQLELVDPNVDPYGYIGFVKNPDGSILRLPSPIPDIPASSDLTNPSHLSKQITINQSTNNAVRIFVPRSSFDSVSIVKLPIVVYFHGGGFVMCSAASALFYPLYDGICNDIPAIIVSVDFRLAPEHRLPAAYDDSMEALHWIKNSNDEWLVKYGDFSKCYLMGSSTGTNVCYHIGLKAASCTNDLKPLEIKGLIFHSPYFGGVERTDSELKYENNPYLPLRIMDIAWELSLPVGADRDHEYSNPKINSDTFDQIKLLNWKILATGFYGDPLADRQIKFVEKLKELGVSVISKFEEGGFHVADVMIPTKIGVLVNLMKEMIESP